MYQRVVIKISGEALSSESASLNAATIERTARALKGVHDMGVQLGVVVGGGNILRGRSSGGMDRNRADHMGMLATVINALALQDALCRMDVPCSVLSAVEMNRFCETFTARDANRRISAGEVVIFACGVGSPFFSTDTGAALRAAEIGADVLLLAKNVDAVYSADPNLVKDAVRYTHLSYDKVIVDDLRATDITAITLCRQQGIPIHVFALSELTRVFETGESVGTIIGKS